MYSEEILNLYAEKPNQGSLSSPSHKSTNYNPTCGDEIHVDLEIENGIVKDVKYTNKKGCFVTVISASALTEKIKGMKTEDVLKLKKEDIDNLLGTKLGTKIIETRIKCELLPLEAIKDAIIKN